MERTNKTQLIKQALRTNDVQPITTDRFDGIWFNIHGNEAIALTNEELHYASNNIVEGDIMEVLPEHELFENINIFYTS